MSRDLPDRRGGFIEGLEDRQRLRHDVTGTVGMGLDGQGGRIRKGLVGGEDTGRRFQTGQTVDEPRHLYMFGFKRCRLEKRNPPFRDILSDPLWSNDRLNSSLIG